MRGYLLAGAALLSAAPAMASSIETKIGRPAETPSISTLDCSACAPLDADARAPSYVVPALEPGTERTEVREIDGKMMVVRAEAWLGGSPVTFISKASDETVRLARAAGTLPPAVIHATATGKAGEPVEMTAETAMNVAVDAALITAALSHSSAASMAGASVPSPSSQDFDGQSFELRLD